MTELILSRVADEDALAALHDVVAAAMDADYEGLPADPVEELLPLLSGDNGDSAVELWLGRLDGTAVAAAQLTLPRHDNTDAAEVELTVHPGSRRRGYGRQLLGHVLARAAGHGRRRAFGTAGRPLDVTGAETAPGPAFARAVGARPVLGEVRRTLNVTTLDPARLASLRADAEKRAAGYSLVQWVDRAPAELHDDLAYLMHRMSTDVPWEDMTWEPEVWDAERYRTKDEAVAARGRRRVGTAVRHDATGRLVGFTDIGVNARRPDVAYQWDTIVTTDHRGHRLGLLLKAANLELLLATVPGVRVVNTWNAAVNRHMIAINEELGFRAVEQWQEWQLDLRAV